MCYEQKYRLLVAFLKSSSVHYKQLKLDIQYKFQLLLYVGFSEGGGLSSGAVAALVIILLVITLLTIFVAARLYNKKFRVAGTSRKSRGFCFSKVYWSCFTAFRI